LQIERIYFTGCINNIKFCAIAIVRGILQKERSELLRISLLFSLPRGKLGLFLYTLWVPMHVSPLSAFEELERFTEKLE
jgi:hypothetical protein